MIVNATGSKTDSRIYAADVINHNEGFTHRITSFVENKQQVIRIYTLGVAGARTLSENRVIEPGKTVSVNELNREF